VGKKAQLILILVLVLIIFVTLAVMSARFSCAARVL